MLWTIISIAAGIFVCLFIFAMMGIGMVTGIIRGLFGPEEKKKR